MTQSQLADISTVSIRAIRDLELDRTGSPRLQTVRLLAEALRLTGVRRAELEAAAGLTVVRSLYDELPAPPATLSPPVAREEEAASLLRLLRSPGHQVVKVAGAPGMGKTSLIQNVVGELHRTDLVPVIHLDRMPAANGSPHDSPSRLISRVAGVVGCGAAVADVAERLAAQDALLIVDNRDLDDRDRQDMRELVQLCRGLRVLVETCEFTAHRTGDITFAVFPLDVPEGIRGDSGGAPATDYPVMQYMLSRSALLYPEESSDPETAAAIAGICWHLDGIPAALESAASWLLIYKPAELLGIAQTAPERLVTSPSRNNVPLMTWMRRSLASLPAVHLGALHKLVDARPWTVRDAVAFLAWSVPDAESAIHDLRARGLVRRVKSPRGGSQRFVVLNLVRHLVHADALSPVGRLESRDDLANAGVPVELA